MSDKRISALTEQTGLASGDYFAVDNAGNTESKKVDQAYFTGQYDDMQNILGSKNLMPNDATTQVVSGITFTKYSDGSIKANGTASANINFVLSSSFKVPKGDYILTDGVKNQSYYVDVKNGSTVIARARDDGAFTLSADATLNSEIWISSGLVLSNVIFYPMVRPANIANTDYVPYAKSNKELTDDVKQINTDLSNVKTYQQPSVGHMGSAYYTDLDIPIDDAVYGIICGVALTDTAIAVATQCYFSAINNIHVRVARWSNENDGYKLTIKYI